MTSPVDRRYPPLHTTGQVARLLGATEPQLSELVRRGRVAPPPEVLAGRRLWSPDHIRQAAEALDIGPDRLGPLRSGEVDHD